MHSMSQFHRLLIMFFFKLVPAQISAKTKKNHKFTELCECSVEVREVGVGEFASGHRGVDIW